ncbi:hypothetical protein [Clostridium sp. OS1-26]|uniref:hypothetical protein n=1 Tax=Clostridium sp. OS1-26 TaxID=3070681 RepID=UPI0027DFD15C|nr:hypothetical protein [Clostridium sp. OS1-26]WML33370.1 hypothetical protein RCG18_18725 [Clostridium sp. OS1-26]
MKKIFLTSLLIAATVTTLHVKTFAADNKVDDSAAKVIQRVSTAPMLTELTGTIEKTGENEIDVKAKDGKTYTVPIDEFSKLDGFKDLNLKVGTEVSLKAMDFSRDFISIKATKIAESSDSKDIKAGKAVIFAKKISDSKNIQLTNNRDSLSTTVTIASKDGEQGKLFFIASELTANGKTLKLDKTSITQAISTTPELKELSGAIEKTGENEINVKAKDGKTYTVPIDEFSKLDGFKGLNLKVGTEVSLKAMEFSKAIKVDAEASPETYINKATGLDAENSELKDVNMGIGATLNLGDTITYNTVSPSGSAEVISVTAKDGEQNKLYFIASELTANGKTLKLANSK